MDVLLLSNLNERKRICTCLLVFSRSRLWFRFSFRFISFRPVCMPMFFRTTVSMFLFEVCVFFLSFYSVASMWKIKMSATYNEMHHACVYLCIERDCINFWKSWKIMEIAVVSEEVHLSYTQWLQKIQSLSMWNSFEVHICMVGNHIVKLSLLIYQLLRRKVFTLLSMTNAKFNSFP